MDIEKVIRTTIKDAMKRFRKYGYGESVEKDLKKAIKISITNPDDDEREIFAVYNQFDTDLSPLDIRLSAEPNYHFYDDDDDDDESSPEKYERVGPDNDILVHKKKPFIVVLRLELGERLEIHSYNPYKPVEHFLEKKISNIREWIDQDKCPRCQKQCPKTDIYDPETGCIYCWTEEMKAHSCSICQDDETPLTVRTIDSCGHQFHSNCLKEWMDRKGTCPLCRKTVKTFFGGTTLLKRKVKLTS